jgi:NADH:ubiquinone oxidoreductase subunit 2 (subunit N)
MRQKSAAASPPQNEALLHFREGKIYFSRQTERRFFFALTVMMLILGLCFKLGIF